MQVLIGNLTALFSPTNFINLKLPENKKILEVTKIIQISMRLETNNTKYKAGSNKSYNSEWVINKKPESN